MGRRGDSSARPVKEDEKSMKPLIKCISAPETKRGLCCLSAVVVAGLMAGLAFDLQAADAAKLIQLDATSPGRVFEGVGALSAGASTRLLPDYPEPQRGPILDFLFKPRFGAGFQHLKVEIGSGENSTCGSEPSHVVTREELANPQPRGYEFWLMAEARKRNPQIILDCLPWAYPHWVGDPFSPESADWFVAFLETARKHYGLELGRQSRALSGPAHEQALHARSGHQIRNLVSH